MSPEDKVSVELRNISDELSAKLEKIAGQPMGFSLLVFNSTANTRMSYISNCARDEVSLAMIELLKGWREGMDDIPAHKVN